MAMTDPYDEEDETLAGVMEEATGHLRKLLPPELYKQLRYDVGLMVELHPDTGAALDGLRHKSTTVDTSGRLADDSSSEEGESESA